MATALLLNTTDLAATVAALTAAINGTSGADRTALTRIRTAIGTPANLPLAPARYQEPEGDVRVIVLPSQAGTKADVLAILDKGWRVAPGTTGFLKAIWKDARSSAVDPWTGA